MKNLSADLKNTLNNSTTHIVRCWKITLTNGDTMGFTTNDESFDYDGVLYNAVSADDLKAINSSLEIQNDDFQMCNLISSELIAVNDILSGKYDNAEIKIFLLDILNMDMGIVPLMNGHIADMEYRDNVFIARVKGLKDEINKSIGELYSPLCRARFCDGKCKLNQNDYSFVGKVDGLIDEMTFQTKDNTIINMEDGYFENGIIEFLSGDNKGYRTEIKQFSKGTFRLMLELPNRMNINDDFKAVAGCDKLFKTCCQKFNNAINFRGEPHLPGIEVLLKFL